MPFARPTAAAAALLTIIAMLAAAVLPASAESGSAFARTAGVTSIPVGHAEFCRANAGECRFYPRSVELEQLTERNWAQLVAVNARMNSEIVPVSDRDLYDTDELWTYPNDGFGDCEDIALAKRRALVEAGWDPSTLLMAVVRQSNGEGHAVLMARTDRGDLVLDNQDGSIRLWSETPYQFLKRQSQTDPASWVDIVDDRMIAVAAR